MNIAVTEEEKNLFPSFAYSSSFLRFTSLSFPHERSINPRFRWDKAVLIQLKGEDNNRLRDGFVTRLHALG